MTNEMKQEYLEFAKELAGAAGIIMAQYFQEEPDERYKEDKTIVTVADEEINQMVIDRVRETYFAHSVDGEEVSDKTDSKYVWVCDPIDGTNPFSMGVAVSVFSLALVVDGVPVVGVIYEPFTDMMYTAMIGLGAHMNGEVIKVGQNNLDYTARVNCGGWRTAEYDPKQLIHTLAMQKGFYTINIGSTTHSSALVARGELAASIFAGTKGKHVDVAAAKVIVEEAGGRVTDLFGNDQRYDGDINGTIMSNGIVHDEIVNLFKLNLVDKRGS